MKKTQVRAAARINSPSRSPLKEVPQKESQAQQPNLHTGEMNTNETIPDSVKLTKTVTVEKIFTTGRKPRTTINISRKGSVVKERCKQLSEIALNLFPERVIPDADLKDLVMMYVGADKETVRSYTGYYGHVRQGRCGDNQLVGLSRKGYLEMLGFMRKVGHGRWAILGQTSLCESVSFPHTYKDSCQVGSNKKISLSLSGSGVASGQAFEETKRVAITTSNNNNTSEKERNFSPMIYPMISEELSVDKFSSEETDVLAAKPCAKEPDKGRVDWGACEE